MSGVRPIAAAQTVPVRGDVDANLQRHLTLAHLAAEARAAALVFPELSLTGYELDLAEGLAFSPNDSRLEPLIELASQRAIALVVGAPVRIESRLHIGAFLISPDRSIGVYTKHHLGAFSPDVNPGGAVPPAEATVFAPGDRNPWLRLGEHRAAIAICADTGRPSHLRRAAERGADAYLAGMFVVPSELERETRALKRGAARHSIAVVMANFGGPSGGLPSAGASCIWSDRGERVVRLPREGAGVALAFEQDGAWQGKAILLDSA